MTDKVDSSHKRPRHTLERWEVEDEAFWQATGRKVANRNLWVSIPNLLCGFAVWLYWGMLAKFIQKLHFSDPELFKLLRQEFVAKQVLRIRHV